MDNKSSKIVSIIQCFAVLLVVLGHSIESPIPSMSFVILHEWIYSFHMPLFMFVSGYLYFYSKKRTYKEHIINKFKRLIK